MTFDQLLAQDSITLPALVWHKPHALGEIRHVVTPQREQRVAEKSTVRVSPRIKEPFLTLESGEKIVVTTRKHCPHPAEADGVLLFAKDGSTWLSHRMLDGQTKNAEWKRLKADISRSWQAGIRYAAELVDEHGNLEVPGLRPPQIGALHAIGAHWSLHRTPATIVMPTGTGKTETMLAALVGAVRGPLLVVVPSSPLRAQTQAKFLTLGLLRQLGVVPEELRNPIVGTMLKRPTAKAELDILKECHVVVATMAAVSQGTASALGPDIAAIATTLIVDEAHHVAARSWAAFRDNFSAGRVLQFTATPFRRDGKLVDGDVIYSYPLRRAQEDGYFKPIKFDPVCEIDESEADKAIANKAVEQLRQDLAAGLDHILMARCNTIERAETVHALYTKLCSTYRPILVHSDDPAASDRLKSLFSRESRVVVCVEMLGEGFDLPQLKIAAVHDIHKSLAVLLQFTGRFTRTAAANIGDATVIANIADQDVSAGLERLYSEDADWNYLLAELSSDAVKEHKELVEFLSQSLSLTKEEEDEAHISISPGLLRPKFSTVAYRTKEFHPRLFHRAVASTTEVHRVWLHSESNTLYFVTKSEPPVQWTRAKSIQDREWHLFVVHHDPDLQLLFIHSSDKSSLHENLAKAVGGKKASLVRGDNVFRTLAGITRLQFQNIGVTKHARRNLRYAMYTGADVKQALDVAQTAGSTKSNLQGTGYEDGSPVAVGCSYKGRVWSKEGGSIRNLTRWCKHVGKKLIDESINTDKIIDNVMVPVEVDQFPDVTVLSLEWPVEILKHQEDRVLLRAEAVEHQLLLFALVLDGISDDRKTLSFHIEHEAIRADFTFKLGVANAFAFDQVTGPAMAIAIGRNERPLRDYLNDYPLLLRFVDLSELDGNLLIRPEQAQVISFPVSQFHVWEWQGTDVKKESLWKDGAMRPDSVQARAAKHFQDEGFDVVFDDDAPGEAADLVCFKVTEDVIYFALVHCKFTQKVGRSDVRDAVEVCAQAVRSGRWMWDFKGLCRHVSKREQRLKSADRPTRFLHGTARELNQILQSSRFKEVRGSIHIVQPGLSKAGHSTQQATVLAAAHCFLNDTVSVPLDVICAA